jgi:hypothetical protein
MVHGRAQEGRDPAAVRKEWTEALTHGAARANVRVPESTVIELPYYGDELDRLVRATELPLAIEANARGTANDADDRLRGEILEELALACGVTREDIEREYAGEPRQKGPQNWEWVQAILRAMDRVPGLNSSAIDRLTRDVYVYLTYPGVRAKIDGMVLAAIAGDPAVVLAHSLGSVVAYNVLVERAATPGVARFITVGSPLAVRGVKRWLATPLRSPACVRHWFNAYDDRDVVALSALDGRGFNVTPAIENKRDVMNFTDDRHGISGYLADPVVAAKIVEYL